MGFFDHFYEGKETNNIANWIRDKQDKRFLGKINNFSPITPSTKLLEIGVGEASFAKLCLEKGIDYTGIEGNAKQANKLKEQGLFVINELVPPLPKDNKKSPFDIIYLSHVLEHMNDCAKAQALIKDIYHNLKEQGIVAIVVPNYLYSKSYFFDVDYTHNYITTPRRVSQLLEDHSLKVVYQECHSGPVFGKLRYIPKTLNTLYPWKLFDLLSKRLLFGKLLQKDFFYKVKLTLAECFVTIAQKV